MGKIGEGCNVMEKERAMMMAAHDTHRNEAMRLTGEVSVRVDHEALAAALVLEAGDGGVVASSAKSMGNARRSSSDRHHPGSGIDGRREVMYNAAKAAML